MNAIKKIGLTGGIASGKSTVANFLREAGVKVIDLDAVGRELTDTTPELQEKIDSLCGGGTLGPHGLDRAKVRAKVFADPAIRKAVEAAVHPYVLKAFEAAAKDAEKSGARVIICEAALLFETGYYKLLDGLIVVTADEPTRRARAKKRDHLSNEIIDGIFAAQSDETSRKNAATHVIENSGSIDELHRKVTELIKKL